MRSPIFGCAVRACQSVIAGTLLLAVALPVRADGTPPSVPAGVSASAGTNNIRVSWSPSSDDSGVAGYNVYRDGLYRTTVGGTVYTDYGASAGTTHRYHVVAYDGARNFTTASATVTASVGSSGNASARTGGDRPGTPGAPRVSALGDGRLQLDWDAAGGNVRGYNVYRDGGYRTTVMGTRWTDHSAEAGRQYRYLLVAFSGDGRFSGRGPETLASSGGTAQVTRMANDDNVARGGAPDGYSLVFSEEFRGSSIDRGRWNTRYRWGPNWIINNEKQYYVDQLDNPGFGQQPFSLDGEHLTISATRTPDNLRGAANSQPWLSGAMTTHNKFTMKYGYVEMRAKLPRGNGLWPAFWLLHENNNEKRPEIDVVEMLGRDSRTIYQTYHHYENYVLRSTPSYEVRQADYADDFHTYGMLWEPGRIVWYVDGRETNRYESGNVSYENMYLLLNLAVGGNWAGQPDGSTPSPARYVIDYVRAYRR